MSTPRYDHTATRLLDGQVLVTGGVADNSGTRLASAELYDPGSGLWSPAGSMTSPRMRHLAVLLSSGKVLVAGGASQNDLATCAELYDPDTRGWTRTGNMNTQRFSAVATLIMTDPFSGMVLVAGGSPECGGCIPDEARAELYDPITGTWSFTGSMTAPRFFEEGASPAARLPDGSVLVVGGITCCPYDSFDEAESYDPQSETWTPTSAKTTRASGFTALMLNGQVLVAGGRIGVGGGQLLVADTELFDPVAGTWHPTASMSTDRAGHTLTVVGSGKVLAAGGMSGGWGVCRGLSSAELYDPSSETWSLTGGMTAGRVAHTATLLLDGRVLVAGGNARHDDCSGQPLATAELYIPPTHASQPPAILVPPSSRTVALGTTASFSVDAISATPLNYQWQFNGMELNDDDRISGSSTSTLQISPVNSQDAGSYSVAVRNVHGSVTSNPASLTVLLRPPEITAEPGDQTVVSGAAATFTVAATGSLPLSYQWRRNGVDLSDTGRITGARTATLNIPAVGTEDVGVYTVVIRNAYGAVTSAPASLAVTLAAPTITSEPQGQTGALGATVSLEVHATGSLPLSYQWQREGVEVMDGGRISGSKTSTLTIAELNLSDVGIYSVVVGNTFGLVRSSTVELNTSSAVLYSAVGDGMVVVSWNDAGRGLTLQRTGSVANPDWRDVPASAQTNRMEFPMTNAREYFRLFLALPPGLVAWWPGDGNGLDRAGTNHGTLVNGVSFAPGIVGQAFSLETGAYVVIADSPALAMSAAMPSTLCSWVLLDEFPDYFVPLTVARTYYYGMLYAPSEQTLRAHVHDGATWKFIDVSFLLETGRWYHAAQVWDGTTMYVYMDGQQLGAGIPILGPEPQIEGVTTLGTWDLNPGRDEIFRFSGLLDEVLVYSRALTDAEVRLIYEAGLAGTTTRSSSGRLTDLTKNRMVGP